MNFMNSETNAEFSHFVSLRKDTRHIQYVQLWITIVNLICENFLPWYAVVTVLVIMALFKCSVTCSILIYHHITSMDFGWIKHVIVWRVWGVEIPTICCPADKSLNWYIFSSWLFKIWTHRIHYSTKYPVFSHRDIFPYQYLLPCWPCFCTSDL